MMTTRASITLFLSLFCAPLFAQFNGLTGVGAGINYTTYGNITTAANEIRPYGTGTTTVTIYQDYHQSGFTTGVDLDQARLYYKTNSSTFGTADDGTWSFVTASISAVPSEQNDRCTFTLTTGMELTPGTDYMFYLRFTEGGTNRYGHVDAGTGIPDLTAPTTAPSAQNQTFKIRAHASAAYNTPRVDGVTVDWQSNTQVESRSSAATGRTLDITYDATYIYFLVNGGFTASSMDRILFGFDINPGTGGNSGGSTSAYNGASFPENYRPDKIYRARGTGTNTWATDRGVADNANGWTTTTPADEAIIKVTAGSNTTNLEVRISRSDIGSFTALGIYVWFGNSSDALYDSYPHGNPTGTGKMPVRIAFTGLTNGNIITASVFHDAQYDHTSDFTLFGITSYRNLDIMNSGGTIFAGAATSVTGNLTVATGGNFSLGANTAALSVTGDVTNSGTLSLSSSSGGDLNVGGNFTQNGTFSPNNRAVGFNGSSNQSISASSSLTLDYLTVNNASGITLGQHLNVDDQFTLTNGEIAIGSFNFNLNAAATISVTNPGVGKMVLTNSTGNMGKIFSSPGSFTYIVGTTGEYSPVAFTMNSLTGSGYVSVTATVGKYSGNNSTTDYLERYWTIQKSGGITALDYGITCNYVQADVAGSNESNIYGGKFDAAWTLLGAVNTTANSFTGSNLTSLSVFTGGEQSVFPVELTDFHAFPDAHSVQLRWRTASEQGNDRFEIERSPDARNWQTLGSLAGAGYSTDLHTYNYVDEKPLPLNFYRLNQIDFDGNHEYSKIISATFGQGGTMHILPNPATNELYLQGTGETFRALIFDQNGRLKMEATTMSIVIEDLMPGVYFLKIMGEGGQSLHVGRFVKQ